MWGCEPLITVHGATLATTLNSWTDGAQASPMGSSRIQQLLMLIAASIPSRPGTLPVTTPTGPSSSAKSFSVTWPARHAPLKPAFSDCYDEDISSTQVYAHSSGPRPVRVPTQAGLVSS